MSETVEQSAAALDIRGLAGGNDVELTCFGRIRISEDRRCDIALSLTRMLGCEAGRRRRADRAHRKMDGSGTQALAKPLDAQVLAPQYDVANGVVVGHHADDNGAVE